MITEKPRFEVDHKGMSTLQAGREPWRLVKELISNAFDEESSNSCEVTIKNIAPRQTLVTVTDNGKGFADIKDAWTLMADTPKRRLATSRGRFNMGEKEILCLAITGSITSNSIKVSFPKGGGRTVEKCEKFLGVKVECLMPWGPKQTDEIVQKLQNLIPPSTEYSYSVNKKRVEHAQPIKMIQATLPTVLVDEADGAIKFVMRKANIGIIKANGFGSWIYEMGIPVQQLGCPWSVDVGQKIPMPPNRDTIRDSYLSKIYTAVLNEMSAQLTDEDASNAWVRSAIESKDVAPEAIRRVVEKRYGKNVVMWSPDLDANQRARDNGYEVVHQRTLSPSEREMFKQFGMVPANKNFGSSDTVDRRKVIAAEKYTDGMKLVEKFSHKFATEIIGHDITVEIVNEFTLSALATFSRGLGQPTLTFNLAKLGHAFFNGANQDGLISDSVMDLVIHEIGHIQGTGHDDVYQRSLTHVAAKAVRLGLEKPEIYKSATYKGEIK